MTEQPVETEQQYLGNAAQPPRLEDAILRTFAGAPLNDSQRAVLDKAMQHYVPNAHRTTFKQFASADDSPAPEFPAADTDLWLDTEKQATRALAEIQDGNINAGIACLQAALAFAQNYRHSLTEETAR